MSAAFLLTTLAVVASPGTGVLYTLGAGLARGRRGSVVAAFGCTLGIVPHLVAAIGWSSRHTTSALFPVTFRHTIEPPSLNCVAQVACRRSTRARGRTRGPSA